jgi:hypothetical protein
MERTPKPETADQKEILLFATTPPADERPDAVAFHLTSETHRRMLRIACAAVAAIPGARLTIKLHPRCRDTEVFRAVAAEFSSLRYCIVRRARSRKLVRRAACILNCTSSAGIEANQLGVPVIELIPEGSSDLLPAREWGTLGTATCEAELTRLLAIAISKRERRTSNDRQVFAASGQDAARRIVDELLVLSSPAAAKQPGCSGAIDQAIPAIRNAA